MRARADGISTDQYTLITVWKPYRFSSTGDKEDGSNMWAKVAGIVIV